jgi:catechol 2,3-dioxygenase-like lactoylglutathione lyase family enzyme
MIVLIVKDIERSRDFYGNVIGLAFAHDENSFQLGPDALLLIDHATAYDLLSPAGRGPRRRPRREIGSCRPRR